jgi:hypothetical protein
VLKIIYNTLKLIFWMAEIKEASLNFVSPCITVRFKYINQPDATISQVYYLTFMYSSTCFGRLHAHHQELNNCGRSLWFYRWSVVIAVLLVVVGPAGRTTTNSTATTTLQR